MASRLFDRVASLGTSLLQRSRKKTRFIDVCSCADLLVHLPPQGAYLFPSYLLQQGNMVFMVQNRVTMLGISHFFLGSVLVKVLFPLTNGFKKMFQSGLDLSTLETSYVSNVCWYFLVMFGLHDFFRLAIGDPSSKTLERNIKQPDLGMVEGPALVVPWKFLLLNP